MSHMTLLVMAAGMGSRFGGMKQLEPVGAHGEVLLDYSAFDARRAGFDRVVFIIKKSMEADFRALAGDRIARHMAVDYAFQETPEFRKKPFGTGDAILTAADLIDSPFAVLNADDFYGADAFRKLHDGLLAGNEDDYGMVAYRLFNTLSDNGTVSRGVCTVKDGYLTDVVEHTAIAKDTDLPADTVVSMNMWGFRPGLFEELREQFARFKQTADVTKDEFLIPTVVNNLIHEGKRRVAVFRTDAVWFGMTYREDKAKVTEAIARLTAAGEYPEALWD